MSNQYIKQYNIKLLNQMTNFTYFIWPLPIVFIAFPIPLLQFILKSEL